MGGAQNRRCKTASQDAGLAEESDEAVVPMPAVKAAEGKGLYVRM